MQMRVKFLASFSGLRIWHCLKLLHWLQTWLRSHMAQIPHGCGCGSDSTPSLGTSICRRYSASLQKRDKRKKRKKNVFLRKLEKAERSTEGGGNAKGGSSSFLKLILLGMYNPRTAPPGEARWAAGAARCPA